MPPESINCLRPPWGLHSHPPFKTQHEPKSRESPLKLRFKSPLTWGFIAMVPPFLPHLRGWMNPIYGEVVWIGIDNAKYFFVFGIPNPSPIFHTSPQKAKRQKVLFSSFAKSFSHASFSPTRFFLLSLHTIRPSLYILFSRLTFCCALFYLILPTVTSPMGQITLKTLCSGCLFRDL